MQNAHRDISQLNLPDEWGGLRWWRSESYRIALPGDPNSVLPKYAGSKLSERGGVIEAHLIPQDWQWTAGVFVGEGDVTIYDPVPAASEVFDAALRVDAGSTEALLAFVGQWGTLGVGTGLARDASELAGYPAAYAVSDTVWATRRALRELQRHFAWLLALRAREWRSPAMPGLWDEIPPDSEPGAGFDACLEAARELVPPSELPAFVSEPAVDRSRAVGWLQQADYSSASGPELAAFVRAHAGVWRARHTGRPRDREEAYWRAFGAAITEHLRLVHPTMRWNDGQPTAAWRIRRLVDLLWVQLWNLATGGATIRQCRHCHKWFPVDRRGKLYCSRVCTNRASAAASYEARKQQGTKRRRKPR